ncbi:unnamed protein product [Phytomonas sp. EM1]|nr:unnamed protein product [Phytomonas sp. EM1]|eukprot:CCW60221.1 unnamed protein product [Phytomonas sp. isolate EM1]
MADAREDSQGSNKNYPSNSADETRSPQNNASEGSAGNVKSEEANGVPPPQKQISLKVVNADGAEMFFKIKRGTQLRKLFDAYCNRQSISRNSIRFLFEGMVIDDMNTPDSLKMTDDDIIDAMVEQTGGASF